VKSKPSGSGQAGRHTQKKRGEKPGARQARLPLAREPSLREREAKVFAERYLLAALLHHILALPECMGVLAAVLLLLP